jgi:hypothetical protein
MGQISNNADLKDDQGYLDTTVRAVPRHNSLEDHYQRLQQEQKQEAAKQQTQYKVPERAVMFVEDVDKLLAVQADYIAARVNYILSKYIGPTHTSYVEVQKFFQNKP